MLLILHQMWARQEGVVLGPFANRVQTCDGQAGPQTTRGKEGNIPSTSKYALKKEGWSAPAEFPKNPQQSLQRTGHSAHLQNPLSHNRFEMNNNGRWYLTPPTLPMRTWQQEEVVSQGQPLP